jgi:hypothetical protein
MVLWSSPATAAVAVPAYAVVLCGTSERPLTEAEADNTPVVPLVRRILANRPYRPSPSSVYYGCGNGP